jgi:small subunit ribosomal protein S17
MDEQVGKEQDGQEAAGQPSEPAGGAKDSAETSGFRQAEPQSGALAPHGTPVPHGSARRSDVPAEPRMAGAGAEDRRSDVPAEPRMAGAGADAAGEPVQAGQAAARPKSRKKVLTGRVVSNKMDKTAVVLITRRKLHRLYKKTIIESKKIKVHDVKNDCQIGDTVRVVECRPMSKDKHWRLLEIVERAK